VAQLFKTAAVFTDAHIGLRQNSRLHNDDCERYIEWFIKQAHANQAETCIFMGDFHHHRNTINVSSLNTTVKICRRLGESFENVYFITGNHDLYFRDKREINSFEFLRDFKNFHVIDEVFEQDNVAIVPWLVGEEWRKLSKLRVKYVFGHFELPHFKMNAMVEMPDHGGINASVFGNVEKVFSGHFHKRQVQNNIHYIGNCFPHDYSDAGDDERGCMILKWDSEPKYLNWPECPKYRVMTLSQLIDQHEQLLDQYTYAKVKLDIGITYEEANFIREKFAELYQVRDMQLVPIIESQSEQTGVELKFETVDQIVVSQLESIESQTINPQVLVEIYRSLDI
jgi:hypothetical protein